MRIGTTALLNGDDSRAPAAMNLIVGEGLGRDAGVGVGLNDGVGSGAEGPAARRLRRRRPRRRRLRRPPAIVQSEDLIFAISSFALFARSSVSGT